MPALYRANSLLGNDPDAAGLEITLGPVSGRLVAELITGERPFTDPAPYSATRFD